MAIGIDELASFCKRKGFVYPSGELYGGIAGFWDFGHLGVELAKNLKDEWWSYHVRQREDIVGIDGSIITNPKVWEASGHVTAFVDIAVICKKCGNKSKVDKHEIGKVKCEKCGGQFENKGEFNPMFVTNVGPVKEDSVKAYLRPETAQSIFANFKLVQDNARLKLPFGIAQIGKAFRNEIAPREFLFRAREFEQMEVEYFVKKGIKCPYMDEIKDVEIEVYTAEMQEEGEDEGRKMKIYEAWKKKIIASDWHAYWIAKELGWFLSLGASTDNFRARQHTKVEKSHYAIDTWDLEYNFPMGWRELQGFANRGDFDLKSHEKASGKSMEIVDEETKVLAEVICEPSLGVGRALLVFLLEAYNEDKKRENVVLKLNPKLAPYKAAVLPLVSKGEVFELAQDISRDLRNDFNIAFDKSGSIGRRYSRNDEVGTPYCITIDDDSLSGKDVTIRDRDTTRQIRVKIKDLRNVLGQLIKSEIKFEKAGKLVETRVKE